MRPFGKITVIAGALVLSSSFNVKASTEPDKAPETTHVYTCESKRMSNKKEITDFLIPAETGTVYGRGCCSHHGGQAYCGIDGRWVCNDGTKSPTCRCD